MNRLSDRNGRVTLEIRKAIQESGESIRSLAKLYGLNPKTVAKWRSRATVDDRKAGPKEPKSTVLTAEEEAVIIAFRRYIPIPLDDCLQALQREIPHLTRSSLHRCLQRYGVSRLPGRGGDMESGKGQPGCFCLYITEVCLGEERLYLFTAVDQVSKFVFAQILERATQVAARDFLGALIAAVPCTVRKVLTDGRMQFTTPGNMVSEALAIKRALERGELMRAHPFEYACAVNDIEHQLVAPHHPWTEAQAEGMDRITGAIMLEGGENQGLNELVRSLAAFLVAFNGGCQLGGLGGVTPYAYCLASSAGLAPSAQDCTTDLRDGNGGHSLPQPTRRGVYLAGKNGERRARDRDGTREAILEAARSRLAKDGPEGLSLSEVARLAGVNRGTAYQHFKTRENLINATSEWVSEKLFRAVFGDPHQMEERAVQSVDVAELIDRLANFAMDNPELSRAWLLQVLSSPDPASDIFWREYQGSSARFVQTHLAQDNIDTEVLSVIMLAGAFLWPVWAQSQAYGADDLRPLANRFAQECLRISMYGNLRSEYYPQIVERLKGSGPAKAV